MSQPRMRKASAAGEVSRVRSSVKASGDSSLNPNRQQQPRSRSKNKIPKKLRYDLDTALVGLCDVWFEDIKPHLIRNKIKVHVHGDGASPASGDHKRAPAAAAACSHYDPGAAPDHHRHQCVNYVDCCVTPPTASKAPCLRPPAPSSPSSPLQLILQSLNARQECKKINKAPSTMNIRSKKKYVDQQSCQKPVRLGTYTVLPADSRLRGFFGHPRPAAASIITHNKGSQTRVTYIPVMVDQATQTTRPVKWQPSAKVTPNIPASSFGRCPGKTTLLPARPKSRPMFSNYMMLVVYPSRYPMLDTRCFANYSKVKRTIRDLQEIQNQIEVLYHSPHSTKFSSSETLLAAPRGKRKRQGTGKLPPWR